MERKIVEYLIEGKGVREITRSLKCGDRRVRRVRALAEEYGYLSGRALPPFPEAVFPEQEPGQGFVSEVDQELQEHKAWIKERLEADWSPITVFEELPVEVGRSSFYRFLARHRLDRIGEKSRGRGLVPEIIHKPGECLQLDWGKLRDVVDPETGKTKCLWAFVGVLGHSRYMMIRLVWTNDIATTLPAIESMFTELGGVPQKITSDNPKCFALQASKYEPLLHPAFERFASHYGCTVELLPPYDPKKKGKVERMMPFVRRLYEAHGKKWHGLEESQDYMDQKVAIANQRRHGTTGLQPFKVFEKEEKPELKELPALAYELEEYHSGKVRKDGYVRFANKHYAVGEEYAGQETTIIANKDRVSIYVKGKLREVYERIKGAHRSKAYKDHHLKPHEKMMRDYSVYLKRAEKIGPSFLKLVEIILAQGQGFVDTRKVWGLLSLDKTYSAPKIEEAARRAYDLESYSYQTVKSLLNLTVHPEEPDVQATSSGSSMKSSSQHKFTRDPSEYKDVLASLTSNQGEKYDSQCTH